jgi:hypothetical protein
MRRSATFANTRPLLEQNKYKKEFYLVEQPVIVDALQLARAGARRHPVFIL